MSGVQSEATLDSLKKDLTDLQGIRRLLDTVRDSSVIETETGTARRITKSKTFFADDATIDSGAEADVEPSSPIRSR